MAPTALTLRPARPEDEPFLLGLYATTRAGEMALVPWNDDEKRAFVAMQFAAQDRHYRTYYPNARFDVVERGGEPIGRLYVDRDENEIRILDVTLAPGCRGAGVGGSLLRALLDEARDANCAVTLHVEPDNPARRLYERLGFRVCPGEPAGVYVRMEWRAIDQLKIDS